MKGEEPTREATMTGYYTTAEHSNNPIAGVISEYENDDDEKRTS